MNVRNALLALLFFLVFVNLNRAVDRSHAEEAMPLSITSDVFTQGGEIPAKYTCQGEDIAPPLQWTGVPGNAKSLVLIVDDPDAPDPKAPRMTWVHWVLYNIAPQVC